MSEHQDTPNDESPYRNIPGDDADIVTKSGSSSTKLIVIIVLVVVVILGCCGGCIYTGYYFMYYGVGIPLKPQIEGTPAIETYIGTVDEIALDFGQTVQQAQSGNDERLALTVSGDKGTGLLLVQQGRDGVTPPDWVILEFDGQMYIVFGEPPEELGAEVVPESDSDDGG